MGYEVSLIDGMKELLKIVRQIFRECHSGSGQRGIDTGGELL